jgi:hypothetical protein
VTRLRPLLVLLVGVAGACGDRTPKPASAPNGPASVNDAVRAAGSGLIAMAQQQDSIDAENPYASLDDPCILVTQGEAEDVVGPLRAPPYRQGSVCRYDAADGQRLELDVQYTGAQLLGRVIGGAKRQMRTGLILPTGRGLDTLDGRWDDADWEPGEILRTRKGDVGVAVVLSNVARPDPAVAARIADQALARLDSPLDYDGGAHGEPPPLVLPRDPCALLERREVQAVIGPLAPGEPERDGDRACTWVGASGRGRTVFLDVTWEDGLARLNQSAGAMALYKANFEDPALASASGGTGAKAVLQEMMQDSAGAALLGAMRDRMQSRGAELDNGSLTLKNDPDVKGPWTRGALVAGSELLVVRKGVCLRTSLDGVGLGGAKALLAAAAARL